MCTGAEAAYVPYIVGAVAAAGSTYASSQAAKQQAQAREAATLAEAQRQAALQQQADAKVQATMPEFTTEQQATDLGEASQTRQQTVAALPSNIAAGDYQGTAAAPAEYKSELSKLFVNAVAKGKEQAKRQSTLSAYRDTALNRAVNLNRAGQGVNLESRLSQGSSGVLPYELGAANNAGSGYALGGQLLGGLSDIASAYAAANAPRATTTTTTRARAPTSMWAGQL